MTLLLKMHGTMPSSCKDYLSPLRTQFLKPFLYQRSGLFFTVCITRMQWQRVLRPLRLKQLLKSRATERWLGTVLEGLAAGAANFDHVIAEFSTVRNWIAANAQKDIGKTGTRLITSFHWKCDYLFCI
jgi:hypothetical protein